MNIYPKSKHTQITYSPKKSSSCKKCMALLKRAFIDKRIIGVHDNCRIEPFLAISRDRNQEVILHSKGHFISDLYFNQTISTKTNLPFIANNQSFYDPNHSGYFGTYKEYLPLTHTQQYLKSSGKFYYNFINTIVYKKKFIVKLGFFGTHFETVCNDNHVRRIAYRKR